MADEQQLSNSGHIRGRAAAEPDEQSYWHIGLDGRETGVSWKWLDDRSSQLAAALAERGLGYGDRLGLGLRNSPQFVLSVFAAWKLGAVPIPVRWDVPDWELVRLKEVINPKIYLSTEDLPWIEATVQDPIPDLPDVMSPHAHGICSSGSTGTPKVIVSSMPAAFNPIFSTPMAGPGVRSPGRRRFWCSRRCITSTPLPP